MTAHAAKITVFTAAVDIAAALGIENLGGVTRLEFTPAEVSITERLPNGDRRTTAFDITLPVGERLPIIAARETGVHA